MPIIEVQPLFAPPPALVPGPVPPPREDPPAALFGAVDALLFVALLAARFLTPGKPPLPELPPGLLLVLFFGPEEDILGALFGAKALKEAALAVMVCVRRLLNASTSGSGRCVKK